MAGYAGKQLFNEVYVGNITVKFHSLPLSRTGITDYMMDEHRDSVPA